MMVFMRVVVRSVLAFVWIVMGWLTLLLLKLVTGWRTVRHLLPFYNRGILFLMGVRLQVHGDICRRGVVYCCNHLSWLDILVVSSVVKAAFVAKQELTQWPLLGLIFRIQNTIFINRESKKSLWEVQMRMQKVLEGDYCVVLFGESTTGDGHRVMPIFSPLLRVLETDDARRHTWRVQPMSLAYTRINDAATGRLMRPHFSWIGIEDLLVHLKRFLTHGHSLAEVVFHEPLVLRQGENRKMLAKRVHSDMEQGLMDLHYPRHNEAQASGVTR